MTIVLAIAAYGISLVSAIAQDGNLEAVYQQWHAALDNNPFLDWPNFFSTNTRDTNFNMAVGAILSNKIALAYFICDKVASNEYAETEIHGHQRLYEDLCLLRYLTGIEVSGAYLKPGEDNFWENAPKVRARFKEDWTAGVFRDPSKQVKELCEAILPQETDQKISPQALSALRRYGIFGLPELTRQMKQHNSKHAFAAYLVVTGQWDTYREFVSNTNQQFTNAEAKLKHVKAWFEGTKQGARGAEPAKLMENISKALAE
ncbi:MAG: hypothetical protein N2379_05290 [Verrucomicrobiae bacterium]|nr:hypothetical protein [Verrucomicrobiae bacterium]